MAYSIKAYSIKETFYSIQGEGYHSGRPAIFLRFAGCNLWTGREEDRADAVCTFCDTEFVGVDGEGGGKFKSAADLAAHVRSFWPDQSPPFVVCTGGEPLLQLDSELVEALHANSCVIAVETNGTLEPPAGIDWICVSPKADSQLLLKEGNELKLVFPQSNALPERFDALEFDHFFLQPMDGTALDVNTAETLQYCLDNPRWRISIQTHKILGVR